MPARRVLFAVIGVFCCVVTVSCEGPVAAQEQVADPAWDKAKGIADRWPDVPIGGSFWDEPSHSRRFQ